MVDRDMVVTVRCITFDTSQKTSGVFPSNVVVMRLISFSRSSQGWAVDRC
jgi:hypothetical protein